MKPVSSIIRRSDGLRRLQCRFLTKKVRKGVKERVAETKLLRLPPRENPRAISEEERDLLARWERLATATFSRRTFIDLVRVWAETSAAPISQQRLIPQLSQHPVDLRPWICDPFAVRDLLLQLRPVTKPSRFENLLFSREDEGLVLDPWFINHCKERPVLGDWSLTGLGWERVAGFARSVNFGDLLAMEEAYLNWDGPSDLADVILSHCQSNDGANWLALFSTLPKDARAQLVEAWTNKTAPGVPCPEGLILLAKPAWKIDPKSDIGLCYLWHGIAEKAPVSQLVEGVILWKEFGWSYAPSIKKDGQVDTRLLRRLAYGLITPENRSRIAREIWDCLLQRPALEPSFQKIFESNATRKVKTWMLRLLREAREETSNPALDQRFNSQFDDIEYIMGSIPQDHLSKAIHFFEAVYWCRSTKMQPRTIMLVLTKLCRAPLTTSTSGQWVWRKLLRNWNIDNLPASSWKRIDDAWRSDNHVEALENGLDRLQDDALRPLLPTALRLRVRLTMETIRMAGLTLPPIIESALLKLEDHPLLHLDLDSSAGIQTLLHILGNTKDLTRWQKHHCGERLLRHEAVTELREKISGIRCEHLLNFLQQELRARSETDDSLDPHTRLYAKAADENRRAYRKLIRRYTRDGEAGILFHPRNRDWLREHTFVKSGVWLSPLRAEIRLEDGEEIILEMERRFEQVLKMGTLVNSCLALDGCNSHSALANAADINKQVVMAYDRSGKFLGRQLVGIAEERQLVCFDVYGQKSDRLEPAFAAFDHQLECSLSLPLTKEDDDYTLKPIVCKEWYDDCAWNPPATTTAKIINLS